MYVSCYFRHSPKLLTMRIALSVLGFFSLTLIILGSLFKIQHWPGAGVMLVIGTTIFSTFFCLIYLIYRVIERKGALDVIQGLVLSSTMSVISMGMLFKVQHWPGAGVMITFGLSLLAFICIPLLLVTFAISKEKSKGLGVLYTTIGVAAISMTFAFNVSRETLQSFIVNEQLVNANTASLRQINRSLYTDEIEKLDEKRVSDYQLIKEQSRTMFELLDAYKVHLIKQTDKLEDGLPAEYYWPENLIGKDNYDVPTNILIGGDEARIRTGEWSASALHTAIDNYSATLMQAVYTKKAQASIELLLTLGAYSHKTRPNEPWEITVFYHQPLVSVLATLTTLQNAVLMAEFVALNDLKSHQQLIP